MSIKLVTMFTKNYFLIEILISGFYNIMKYKIDYFSLNELKFW